MHSVYQAVQREAVQHAKQWYAAGCQSLLPSVLVSTALYVCTSQHSTVTAVLTSTYITQWQAVQNTWQW
jgi:hypothetical protein